MLSYYFYLENAYQVGAKLYLCKEPKDSIIPPDGKQCLRELISQTLKHIFKQRYSVPILLPPNALDTSISTSLSAVSSLPTPCTIKEQIEGWGHMNSITDSSVASPVIQVKSNATYLGYYQAHTNNPSINVTSGVC